ncbi:MAG: quinolinate synthase NadA [Nitrospirota bacterium]
MLTSTDRELTERILKLKAERKAVILSHNYQVSELQDIADFVGDSLELSQQAAKTDAAVIVFCGVDFMAETAAILCPDKTVLIPDRDAGCSMSDMITVEQLRAMKAKHPAAVVVCYVNTTAAIKAESDICCTSANAVRVVESIPKDKEIIFIPDQFLGQHVMEQTGRKMILYNGYCPTHFRIMAADLLEAKAEHPKAQVFAHPECTSEVTALADQVASTSGISRAVKASKAEEVIIATETGILHRIQKENPTKKVFAACQWCDCAHMKVNTLEKLLWSLEDMQYVVTVPEEIRVKAKRAIDRMLALG